MIGGGEIFLVQGLDFSAVFLDTIGTDSIGAVSSVG